MSGLPGALFRALRSIRIMLEDACLLFHAEAKVRLFHPSDAGAYLPPHVHYDARSIKKQSFWLDLKLIGLSFWITLRGTWEYRGKKF
ncbi:MAG: hypothetical protein HYZ81_11870 [Nitrospinae bacterium]|nr:hypothetical protein [Nitrospinota bacterium]